MELMEDLDPEEARAIVDPALKLMIDAVHRYDGYIVQSTGDGIFALFGAPVAHEDHPQRALYAALRMQEDMVRYSGKLREAGNPPIESRVGVNTGEVVVRTIRTDEEHTEYTPIGHATSLAARMQTLAPSGSTAVTETTEKLCAGYFNFKALGPTRIKGVGEPINVFQVTGLGPLRTRLQRAVGQGLTKFVGRQREMEALEHALEQTRAGHGQIVAAMAEPGVGKSRLFYEFKATTQSGWMVLEALSVSHGKSSAYLPVIDLLHSYFLFTSEDDVRIRREKVTGRVLALDRTLEETLPYLFALLGLVEGEDQLAQMDGQIKRRRTLQAIKRILLRESLNQPLMVIFEDLHWIDEQTQEFLNLLADSIGTAKILLLVNYRPEYSLRWNSRTYYTQLRLDPLGRESAAEMLSALLGDNEGLNALKRLIIEKTEGTPFFMEEMVQVLFDEGALVRHGATHLTRPLEQLKIPATVQAILASRIDRLPPDAKDLLQTLAVIGREFPLSLIRAVVTKSEEKLNRLLNDLQLAEFIYEQPAVGDTQYIFKHALTQEVSHNSVLLERRRQLHERIGGAIETVFRENLEDYLAELSHHYSRSANRAKALEFLHRAGEQAIGRSSYSEAESYLAAALGVVGAIPDSPDRDARELRLLSSFGQTLLVTKGVGARELLEMNLRARALAEKIGNLPELALQLARAATLANASGDYFCGVALADKALETAQREGSPFSLAYAHQTSLQARLYMGEFVVADEHFARGRVFCEAPGFSQVGAQAAISVATYGPGSWNAWITGHPDAARERVGRMRRVLEGTQPNPYVTVIAQIVAGNLHTMLRQFARAEALAGEAIASCEEHGFPGGTPSLARAELGLARAELGHTAEGVSLLREGLAGATERGARYTITVMLTYLAEAQALDGAVADALATIDNALRANPQELFLRPETLRVRGELRLRRGDCALAEYDFREAISLAQKLGAKAWELRASTSLARLLRDNNRRHEGRAMLAEIYNWFTEGFDTADLKDAKALLDEMSN
jgi:class 3 adenylate cyclase